VRTYELLLILNPTLNEDERVAALERVNNVVSKGATEVSTVEEWGKRKLAYEIDKMNDGDYVLYEFKAEPGSIAEINRVLGITDAIVRFIIVKRDDK